MNRSLVTSFSCLLVLAAATVWAADPNTPLGGSLAVPGKKPGNVAGSCIPMNPGQKSGNVAGTCITFKPGQKQGNLAGNCIAQRNKSTPAASNIGPVAGSGNRVGQKLGSIRGNCEPGTRAGQKGGGETAICDSMAYPRSNIPRMGRGRSQ